MLHKYETIPVRSDHSLNIHNLTSIQFHVPLNLWNPQRDRRKVFPEDILADLESLIGKMR